MRRLPGSAGSKAKLNTSICCDFRLARRPLLVQCSRRFYVGWLVSFGTRNAWSARWRSTESILRTLNQKYFDREPFGSVTHPDEMILIILTNSVVGAGFWSSIRSECTIICGNQMALTTHRLGVTARTSFSDSVTSS
jgi:hypothetical protein